MLRLFPRFWFNRASATQRRHAEQVDALQTHWRTWLAKGIARIVADDSIDESSAVARLEDLSPTQRLDATALIFAPDRVVVGVERDPFRAGCQTKWTLCQAVWHWAGQRLKVAAIHRLVIERGVLSPGAVKLQAAADRLTSVRDRIVGTQAGPWLCRGG